MSPTHPSTSPSSTQPLTSSSTGTFYLAYGSNLSPTQMRSRLPSPLSSSVPIAIARLDGWKWIINGRGYANVVEFLAPPLVSDGNESGQRDENIVYGLLYNLSPANELLLDGFEGVSSPRNRSPVPNPVDADRLRKPHLQGTWDYNKLYLDVSVTKWLVDPGESGLEGTSKDEEDRIRALVYVDEIRVTEAEIQKEYIGRMNRAIDESVALGVPGEWCEGVMRKWVAKGVYPRGYVVGG
jgi:hypothetical protein